MKKSDNLENIDNLDELIEAQKVDKTQLTILILGIITFILLFTFIFFVWRDTQKKSLRENGSQPDKYVAEQNEDSTANISTEYDAKIKDTMSKMTLEEKVYQLFIVSPETLCSSSNITVAGDTTRTMLSERPVGGIVYSSANITDENQISTMISNSQSYSKIPLFIAVEEEGGNRSPVLGSYIGGSSPVDDMASIGSAMDTQKAYDAGTQIGTTLSKLGFNLDLAPVADVLLNENNTSLKDRAFSGSADVTSKMLTQVVMGLENQKVAATLKHFPGEGSLDLETHNDYIVVNDQSLEDLENYNLPPFKAGIAAGADFVMVSHAQIPSLTGGDEPGSLSSEVVEDLLRNKLKFNGVIITDTMRAVALVNYYQETEAAVKAINAGCDMIYDPYNVVNTAQAILDAVSSGKIKEERINQSVERILRAKYKNIDFSIAGKDVLKKAEDTKAEDKDSEKEEQTDKEIESDTTGTENSTTTYDDGTGYYDYGTGTYDDGTGYYDYGTGTYDDGTGYYDYGTGTYDDGTGYYDYGTGYYDTGTGYYDYGTGYYDDGTGYYDYGTGYYDYGYTY